MFQGMLLYVMLVCLMMASLPQVNAQQVRTVIFIGREAEASVSVPTKELGEVLDLAYDPQSKQLFMLAEFPDGFHVKQWSAAGKQLADWKVPNGLLLTSILHMRHGQLRMVMWDKTKRQNVLVSFVSNLPKNAVVENLALEYGAYDKSLNPTWVNTIRKVLKKTNFRPMYGPMVTESPSGVAIGDPIPDRDLLIDSFKVNARFIEHRIAWTDNLSVLSFGTAVMQTGVEFAFKQPNGRYKSKSAGNILATALGLPPEPVDEVDISGPIPQLPDLDDLPPRPTPDHEYLPELLSLLVSNRIAVYGIKVEDVGAKPAKPKWVVIWLDIKSSTPKVIRKSDGVLARVLERF